MSLFVIRYLYEGTERTERLRADHHVIDDGGTVLFFDSLDGLLLAIAEALVIDIQEIKPKPAAA